MTSKCKFDNFILNLTDHELAVFYKNRYDDFMSNSKQKITDEMTDRNLQLNEVNRLSSGLLNMDKKDRTNLCQRCGSDYLKIETDVEHRPKRNYTSVDVAIETRRCQLCGFNPDKEKSQGLISRLKRIFISRKTERIVKRYDY